MAFPPVLTGTDGVTQLDAAHFAAYDADMLSALKDASTQTPAETTTEVRNARGNLASLKARLDVHCDDDGNLLIGVTNESISQFWSRNLVGDDQHLIWPNGDAAAPAYATLSGTGAAVARTGSGLADTQAPEMGQWCVKLTSGGGDSALLTKTIIPAALMSRFVGLAKFVGTGDSGDPPNITIVVRAKASTGSAVRAFIDVGSGSSFSGTHTGGGAFETLTTEVALVDASTKVEIAFVVGAGGISAYFGPVSVYINKLNVATLHIPGDWIRKEKVVHFAGSPGTGTRVWSWAPRRPAIVTDCTPYAGTAPGVGGLVFDINSYDGAALTSMFTKKPTCGNGVSFGPSVAPDGTYARRCLLPKFSAGLAAGCLVTADIDAENSAADYGFTLGYLEPARPLEAFLNLDSI